MNRRIILINKREHDEDIKENKTSFSLKYFTNVERKTLSFLKLLQCSNELFDSEYAFNEIKKIEEEGIRLSYSTISNLIYGLNEKDKNTKNIATIISNIEKLESFVESSKCRLESKEEKLKYQRIICKLWDHISLANQQFLFLHQSEEEYDDRFKNRINNFKGDLMSDISNHMITIVSIFTTLSFILFGSISSLQSIFSQVQEVRLIKLLIIACVWGFCLLNIVFVFLFSIHSITNKKLSHSSGNFIKNHPIFCWTNFLLFTMIIILLFIYYILFFQQNTLLNVIHSWFYNYTALKIVIISLIILYLFKKIAEFLLKNCK